MFVWVSDLARKMQHFAFAICSVLLVITSLLVTPTFAQTRKDDTLPDVFSKRKQSAVLFGTRLRRRKRNPGNDAFKLLTVENDFSHLLDQIQSSPWAIVAISEGKRHVSGFTPRLGRDSDEDSVSGGSLVIANDRWTQDQDNSADLMIQRSPPFAPRLGRRQVPFSPRLGRDFS